MVVRISRGSYPPGRHAALTARLADSARSLVPALTAWIGAVAERV